MEKWADYLISGVSYNKDKTYITFLKIHEDAGDKVSNLTIQDREWVISRLEEGKTFFTIIKNKEKNWDKGEEIHILLVNDKKFIRTDKNDEESDNLGTLPEF